MTPNPQLDGLLERLSGPLPPAAPKPGQGRPDAASDQPFDSWLSSCAPESLAFATAPTVGRGTRTADCEGLTDAWHADSLPSAYRAGPKTKIVRGGKARARTRHQERHECA